MEDIKNEIKEKELNIRKNSVGAILLVGLAVLQMYGAAKMYNVSDNYVEMRDKYVMKHVVPSDAYQDYVKAEEKILRDWVEKDIISQTEYKDEMADLKQGSDAEFVLEQCKDGELMQEYNEYKDYTSNIHMSRAIEAGIAVLAGITGAYALKAGNNAREESKELKKLKVLDELEK